MKTLKRQILDFMRHLAQRMMMFLHQHTLMTFVLLFCSIVIISGFSLEMVDTEEGNPLWRSLVYMLSGLDVDQPRTPAGQAVSAFILICGVILVSLLTGYIASAFSRLLMASQIVPRKPEGRAFEDHVIIFGWNAKTKAILRELDNDFAFASFRTNDFVVISAKPELEKGALDIYHHVWHVPSYGSANDIQVLRNADLTPHRGSGARVAAILSDSTLDRREADDRTLLNLLAVENLFPDVISIAEVMQDDQIEHFQNAYADELVLPHRYCSILLARTCEHPGVSSFVDELLALAPMEVGFGQTNENNPVSFYIRSAEELGVAGKRISEAVMDYYQRRQAIIAGLIDREKVTLVPDLLVAQRQAALKNSDWLVVVATPEQV